MKFVPPTAEDQDVFRLLKSKVIESNTQRDARHMEDWGRDRSHGMTPAQSAEFDRGLFENL